MRNITSVTYVSGKIDNSQQGTEKDLSTGIMLREIILLHCATVQLYSNC